MSYARIEEVSDSDPNDSDPSEGDISDVASDFDERDIIKRRAHPSSRPAANQSLLDPSDFPDPDSPKEYGHNQEQPSAEIQAKFKSFQCIYPIYFDKNRSRTEGRRVGVEQAVHNPLARDIVEACAELGLQVCFEPMKTHPKDWSNPGRVKVGLKEVRGIKNKHHLYTLISKHLIAHPTTEASALRTRIPGAPLPDPKKPYPKPAIPNGWKMGTILPYYGAALSGGGISDNFFQDMMAEMQNKAGGGMPGMPGMGGMGGMMESLMGGFGGSSAPAPSAPKKQTIRAKKGKN